MSTRAIVGLTMVWVLGSSVAACTSVDPTYCDSDHPECGAGQTCNFSTLTCVAAEAGAGDTGANDAALLDNGETCSDNSECHSGVCSSGEKVCCDRQCNGTCESCKNKSACTPKPKGTACGANPSCVDSSSGSSLTKEVCDGKSGSCQKTTASCDGYRCSNATSCATSCSADKSCVSGICDLDGAKNSCVDESKICFVDDDSCPAAGSGTRADPYCSPAGCTKKKAAYIALFPGKYATFSVSFNTQVIGLSQAKPVLSATWCDLTEPAVYKPTVALEAGASGMSVSGAVTVVLRGLLVEEKSTTLSGALVESQSKGAELVLRQVFVGPTNSASAVGIAYGTLIMRDALVNNPGLIGVSAAHATLDLDHVLVSSPKSYGIWVANSSATLKRVVIAGAGLGGLRADGAKLTADRVIAYDGGTVGLELTNKATGTSTNMVAASNAKEGVKLSGGSTITLDNATIADNHSGGVQLSCDTSATTNVFNSIVWNGSSGGSYAGKCTFQYSVALGAAGVGNLSSDPRFVAPTATPPDYRLKVGSPAIDAGDNKAFAKLPARDLVGNPRTVKKTAAQPTVDMGAYELQ